MMNYAFKKMNLAFKNDDFGAIRFMCEPMPLEATADNVQLSVFAAKAVNSTEAVRPFLRSLIRLTDYLVGNGLCCSRNAPFLFEFSIENEEIMENCP